MPKKSDGRSANMNKLNTKKSDETVRLLYAAAEYMRSQGWNSIPEMVEACKIVDTKKKGLSESSLRNKDLKHIQEVLKECRIGPYSKLPAELDEIDVTEYIRIQTETKNLQNKVTNLKKSVNSHKKDLNECKVINMTLRDRIISLEQKMLIDVPYPVNNED